MRETMIAPTHCPSCRRRPRAATLVATATTGHSRRRCRSSPQLLTIATALIMALALFVPGTEASFIRSRRMSTSDIRAEIVRLVNEERARHGKPAVCTNTKLMSASQVMATDMAQTDYFTSTHGDTSSPAERVSDQGFVFTTLTEDVAAGYESAKDAIQALLQVQEHRDNILGDYDYIGAGYTYAGRQGYKHYWALHIANAFHETCDEIAPEQVEEESILRRWLHF